MSIKESKKLADAEKKTSEELGRNVNSHAMEEAVAFGIAAAVVVAAVNYARVGAVLLVAGFRSEVLKNPGAKLENPTTVQSHRQSINTPNIRS